MNEQPDRADVILGIVWTVLGIVAVIAFCVWIVIAAAG